MTRKFVLLNNSIRQRAVDCLRTAPEGFEVVVKEPTRSTAANAAMWPILIAFSEQLEWPVNGVMTKLTPEEWKTLLSAAFRKETRVAMGLDGGFVMLGERTSTYGKSEFSDFLEFLHATAVKRGVTVYQDEKVAA